MSPVTVAVGSILAVAATVTSWPQTIRILRTKITTGVSSPTASMATITMFAWGAYTFRLQDWPAFASSVGPFASWLFTLILLAVHHDPYARRHLLYNVVAWSALIAITCTPWWEIVGWGAGVGSALWTLPQLRIALSRQPLHGVSIPAYALLTAENAGWIVYAILTQTATYALGPVIQGPTCALIAWRAWHQRRHLHRVPTSTPDNA